MIKRILICAFISINALAMEEREAKQEQQKSTPEEVAFNCNELSR